MADRFAYRVELRSSGPGVASLLGGGTCEVDQVLEVTHSRRSRMVSPSLDLYSSCYDVIMVSTLAKVARESDAAVRHARDALVRAVRDAAASGMTQAQIAEQIGRSQPEVSRLLRFHGTTPLARRLRTARPQILRLLHDAGGEQVRVFGSVARGDDVEGSDVDLLFVMRRPLSLMELGRLEDEVAAAVGVAVDLVPESSLRPALRGRALAEAVPL